MNEASPNEPSGLLTTQQLAALPDRTIGSVRISPSTRSISGPGGTADVEPRVMQVLVVLADSAGQVVTRQTLFERCWGGVYVGDDSLNRVIMALRKLAASIGAGSFEVETIPRTGYRLVPTGDGETSGTAQKGLSRRALTATTLAAAAALGGIGWWRLHDGASARFESLMERGDEAFRSGAAFDGYTLRSNRSPTMISLYEQAVEANPGSARAWGLLAYFRATSLETASAAETPQATESVQTAIRRAFALDPEEPNARVASYLIEGQTRDWLERDRFLRSILRTGPDNLPAMSELMQLLQAAGLTRESWGWNEKILARSQLARPFLVVRAMKLWILGRIREADSVIDRVRGLWPDYLFGYRVRFLLFVATDRPAAGRAMLESAPQNFRGERRVAMWRKVLDALERPTPAAIATARAHCLDIARSFPDQVNDMVMMLGALGETDAAFEVTQGFILWRGKVVSSGQSNGKLMDDYSRRMTQWLFTPPLAALRADPRFATLCQEFGLTDYWRARGVRPDYQRFGA